MKTTALILSLAGLLAGCANTPTMRTLAEQSASYAGAQARSLDAYSQSFADNEGLQISRTASYEADAARQRDEFGLTKRFWDVAGRTAPEKRLESINLATPEQIVAGEISSSDSSMPVPLPEAGFAEAAKLLTGLSQRPNAVDQAMSIIGFAQSVDSALAKIKTDAQTEANATKTPTVPAK